MKMNEKMINDTANTVVPSVKFLCENDLTYMQLVTDNLNNEFSKGFGTTFSNEFRNRQLDFLRNISSSFDMELYGYEEEVADAHKSTVMLLNVSLKEDWNN